ncbi:MAG: hypothetical protein GXO07_04100 [Crenarchaeota archaeon]|nr:hypothetical protein [Thermoproteota archaeon]
MEIETESPEEAERLASALRPDDVPVKNLSYRSEVLGNELRYLFESNEVLKIRVAVDEVLEHSSLVEAIKGLSEHPGGVPDSVREEKGGD